MRIGSWISEMSAIAIVVAVGMSSPATAQYYGGQTPGMMGPGMMGQMMSPGMMGNTTGSGMMGQGMMGPGMMGHMMGPGMMGQGTMGPGMMGHMMGPGMMGSSTGMYGPIQPAVSLSTNDVKVHFERWIAGNGNPNIKVGNVVEKDTNTITADIVTKENSLVQQFTIDRRTGFYRPAQ